MTQKTVAVRFWTVETSKGYWVLYQIDDNDPIPLQRGDGLVERWKALNK